MELAKIFLSNSFNNVKSISMDSKIYEAFKPYLFDTKKISLEEFMKDKELRYAYREKYQKVKAKLQKISNTKCTLKDEECFAYIFKSCQEWQEFIETAKDNTLDNGESFIRALPLDRYLMMTNDQKSTLEENLIKSAITRVRTISQAISSQNNNDELNAMLKEKPSQVSKENHQKIQ